MASGFNYKNFSKEYEFLDEINDENLGKIKIYENKLNKNKVFEKIRLLK
jgi:hypothetical protein